MTKLRIILGDHLFPNSVLPSLDDAHIFMAEDHDLCTRYRFHKHKIVFFLSAMRHYRDQLQESGHTVHYYDADHKLFKKPYTEKLKDCLKQIENVSEVSCFEIEDKAIRDQVESFCEKVDLSISYEDSPMFMVSKKAAKEYLDSVKKPFMKTFYERFRSKFNILMAKDSDKPEGDQWSFDQENRKKLPKNQEPPKRPDTTIDEIDEKVMSLVAEKFEDHPGSVDNFWIPTTRRQSLYCLREFIDNRLENFGDYQDAITQRSDFVYHAVLSPMMNSGLILPKDFIERLEEAYRDNREKAPLNAVEGAIRQVLGWREFVRMIYHEYHDKMYDSNFWDHKRKLGESWYTGDTGIPPLDDAICKAQKLSYNHHIERLMIVSNIMLLCEVDPKEAYRWFMEMFADSADWVMAANVFGMGQFSEGGIFATKPYICGSNYILKMSDYKKGDWCDILDGLYWRFIDQKKDFISKNQRLSMMARNLEKMDSEKKDRIFSAAETFIEEHTNSKYASSVS